MKDLGCRLRINPEEVSELLCSFSTEVVQMRMAIELISVAD